MAAAPDRYHQLVLSRKANRRDHIGDPGTPHDQRRTPVDAPVPDVPRRLVLLIAGTNQRSAKLCREGLDGCLIQSPSGSCYVDDLICHICLPFSQKTLDMSLRQSLRQ